MRSVLGLLLIGAVAVLAATTLGANDGLVSIYWRGWRVDLSLNLFLLLAVAGGLLGYLLVRTTTALVGLPQRAREWRRQVRERAAQQALREALALLLAGRYSRSQRAAQRGIDIRQQAGPVERDAEFAALAHLVAAVSLHRLQDRKRRDEQHAQVLSLLQRLPPPAPLLEGASLLAAEWALDDRNARLALQRLEALPTGVARRTHALRLKLQAARLAREPLEALRTARLLAKHQGFTPAAAAGLLRALAVEALDQARDAEQLRRLWAQLDPADRRDPLVCAHVARLACGFGAHGDARAWLKPHWTELPRLSEAERQAVLDAFVSACEGLTVDWLPLIEAALSALPADPQVAYAAGVAMAQRALWGRAARLLEGVTQTADAPATLRRDAWLQLALIAEREDDTERAQRCHREIARLLLAARPNALA
ncbi:MAG: heme biosynthesis HemY N-terminal domain-containing protein [Burkholderiales bacterium]